MHEHQGQQNLLKSGWAKLAIVYCQYCSIKSRGGEVYLYLPILSKVGGQMPFLPPIPPPGSFAPEYHAIRTTPAPIIGAPIVFKFIQKSKLKYGALDHKVLTRMWIHLLSGAQTTNLQLNGSIWMFFFVLFSLL